MQDTAGTRAISHCTRERGAIFILPFHKDDTIPHRCLPFAAELATTTGLAGTECDFNV